MGWAIPKQTARSSQLAILSCISEEPKRPKCRANVYLLSPFLILAKQVLLDYIDAAYCKMNLVQKLAPTTFEIVLHCVACPKSRGLFDVLFCFSEVQRHS